MDSLRVGPDPPCCKDWLSGGIRCYVTATDPSLRREEKLKEPGFIFFTQVRKLKKINLIKGSKEVINLWDNNALNIKPLLKNFIWEVKFMKAKRGRGGIGRRTGLSS